MMGTSGQRGTERGAGARRLADLVYVLLLWTLVLLAGWHLARQPLYWDLTGSGRNRLNQHSLEQLRELQAPLEVRVFVAPEHPLAREIEQVLMRYRRASDLVHVEYIDPIRSPELAHEFDVRLLGQLVLEYRGRRERLSRLDEATLTHAIGRLTLARTPWIAVLEGHGERSPSSGTGRDIGRFAQWLEHQGFRLQTVDLARVSAIPANTDVLVLSVPVIDLFPGEVEALIDYVAAGGHLLWLLDPGDWRGFAPLAEAIGLRTLPGRIVDAAGSALGVDSPDEIVLGDWPDHPLWAGLGAPVFFAGVLAFAPDVDIGLAPGWQVLTGLQSSPLSWNETGPIQGRIARDPAAGEVAGPLPFALVVTREVSGTLRLGGAAMPASALAEQRVVVIGDGDFLSDAGLERGANRALGLRLVRWLSGLEPLATPGTGQEQQRPLALTPARALLLSVFALIVLPFGFLLCALLTYWSRRHS